MKPRKRRWPSSREYRRCMKGTEIRQTLHKAEAIMDDTGMLAECKSKAKTMFRMIRASFTGKYKGVSVSIVVGFIGAILYLLNPMDMVPDAIPVIGYLDDIAVIGAVIDSALDEIAAFELWECRSKPNIDAKGGKHISA